jgi:hypothetical protein
MPEQANLVRDILPEGRVLFRAAAYGLLALGAFALPMAAGWWAGLFLSYLAANALIGKMVANVSDLMYRIVTRRPADRRFARWRDRLEQSGDVPDDAYELYARGLTPREARDAIMRRKGREGQ